MRPLAITYFALLNFIILFLLQQQVSNKNTLPPGQLVTKIVEESKPEFEPLTKQLLVFEADALVPDTPTMPKYRLVVGIFSAPHYFERRKTIRDTWLRLANTTRGKDWIYAFVIGKHRDRQVTDRVAEEQKTYGDLVFVDMPDSYGALSEKTMRWAKYSFENWKFDYWIKGDDDSFLRTDRLLYYLNFLPTQRVYMGQMKEYDKSDIPAVRRPLKYIGGASYLLSRDIFEFLYHRYWDENPHPNLHSFEDVNTGLFMSEIGVTPTEPRIFATCDEKTVLIHHLKESVMARLWEMTEADMNIKTYCIPGLSFM